MSGDINILVISRRGINALDAAGAWRALVDRIAIASNLNEARSWLDDEPFDLVVVEYDRRGAFPSEEVCHLQHEAPLCRFVAVTGPLCEGVWRRGVDLLPGVTILPSHRWTSWLSSNASQIRRDMPAAWSLPKTAAVDEMAEFWSHARLPAAHGVIGIDCTSRDAAEAIGDMLSLASYASSWHAPNSESFVHGVTALVVEANGWNDDLAHRVHSLRDRYADPPLLLLLNFPLPADISAAQLAGATAVLGKPFTLSEFLGQLNGSVASSGAPDVAKVA